MLSSGLPWLWVPRWALVLRLFFACVRRGVIDGLRMVRYLPSRRHGHRANRLRWAVPRWMPESPDYQLHRPAYHQRIRPCHLVDFPIVLSLAPRPQYAPAQRNLLYAEGVDQWPVQSLLFIVIRSSRLLRASRWVSPMTTADIALFAASWSCGLWVSLLAFVEHFDRRRRYRMPHGYFRVRSVGPGAWGSSQNA